MKKICKSTQLVYILIVSLWLASCLTQTSTPTASPTDTIASPTKQVPTSTTLFPTASSTFAPTLTPTFTSIKPFLDSLRIVFSKLPKGMYLATTTYDGGNQQTGDTFKIVLNLLTENDFRKIETIHIPYGIYFTTLAGNAFYGFPFEDESRDGIPLIDFTRSFYIDLNNLQEENLSLKIPEGMKCFYATSSPDGKRILASCENGNYSDLYILSGTHEAARITNCADVRIYCGTPQWSADGQWITYLYASEKSGVHPEDGFYEAKVACQELSPACFQTGPGPFYGKSIAISPDGKAMAIPNAYYNNQIQIYRLGYSTPMKTIMTNLDVWIDSISWTPDSQSLAIIADGKIYVLSSNEIYAQPVNVGKGNNLAGWIIRP